MVELALDEQIDEENRPEAAWSPEYREVTIDDGANEAIAESVPHGVDTWNFAGRTAGCAVAVIVTLAVVSGAMTAPIEMMLVGHMHVRRRGIAERLTAPTAL